MLTPCFAHVAESIVGDITPMDPVPKYEKNRREVTTIDFLANRVLAGVPGHGAAELEAIWNEFEAGETEEAKFAQDLDKFELLLQAVEYERLMIGERDLSSFISVAGKIQLVEVKSWAEVVIKERNAMWEGWGKTPATVGEETM
jgi:putative hydrolase of HD superfamily